MHGVAEAQRRQPPRSGCTAQQALLALQGGEGRGEPGRGWVREGVWRPPHWPLLQPGGGGRVWVSPRTNRIHDQGRGTGFPGSLPRPKLFLPSWVGGRKEEAGPGRWGQPSPPGLEPRSGRPSGRGSGECVFKSEPPAPCRPGPGLGLVGGVGVRVAGVVIGGLGRPPLCVVARGAGTPAKRRVGSRCCHRGERGLQLW